MMNVVFSTHFLCWKYGTYNNMFHLAADDVLFLCKKRIVTYLNDEGKQFVIPCAPRFQPELILGYGQSDRQAANFNTPMAPPMTSGWRLRLS